MFQTYILNETMGCQDINCKASVFLFHGFLRSLERQCDVKKEGKIRPFSWMLDNTQGENCVLNINQENKLPSGSDILNNL